MAPRNGNPRALPGLTREEARALFAHAQAQLLASWAETEAAAVVPVRLVGVAS